MLNMRDVLARSLVLLLGLSIFLPSVTHAEFVDLSIAASSVRFSETTLYANETVRIYATIRNTGDADSTAQVFFYKSDYLIGKSQPISVLAGAADDVFVDYKLPEGSFNIRAVIQGADPADSNSANDVAITPLFKTISDDDRDGVLNDNDNCVDNSNADQADYDQDTKGDECDYDMDNDGVGNNDDDYPRDASKSKNAPVPPPVVAEPKTEPVPAPVVKPATTVAEPVETTPEAESPAPEVQGVQDEGEAITEEPTELALDLSGLGYGGPVSSPAARFSYKQLDWRTYEFVALPPLGGGSYTFAWDFGDGATSVQSTITHSFPSSGVYNVTLATVAADGTVTSDAQQLSVSFFHLANPLLLVSVAVLLLIIGGLLMLIIRLRRGEEV